MSKYKHWWRPNVERAIKQYPMLCEKKKDLQAASMTANYNAMPSGNEPSRTTENLGTRFLSEQEEKILFSVGRAIDEIMRQRDGEDVMRIVTLVDFKQTHTVDGAAIALYMHRNTAACRRTRFIDLVGKYMGY